MEESIQLVVRVIKCTFAKPLNYFLSFQLVDGEVLRTEVAAKSSHPEYYNNAFTFVLGTNPAEEATMLTVSAVAMLPDKDKETKSILLGTSKLNCGRLVKQNGASFTTDVALTRKSKQAEGSEIVVGKVKIQVAYQIIPGEPKPVQILPPEAKLLKGFVYCMRTNLTDELKIEGRLVSKESNCKLEEFKLGKTDKDGFQKLWPLALFETKAIAPSSSTSPLWVNQPFAIKLEARDFDKKHLLRLDIINAPTKEILGGIAIPLETFQASKQYNFRVKPSADTSFDVSLETQQSNELDMQLFSSQKNLNRFYFEVAGSAQIKPGQFGEHPLVRIEFGEDKSTSDEDVFVLCPADEGTLDSVKIPNEAKLPKKEGGWGSEFSKVSQLINRQNTNNRYGVDFCIPEQTISSGPARFSLYREKKRVASAPLDLSKMMSSGAETTFNNIRLITQDDVETKEDEGEEGSTTPTQGASLTIKARRWTSEAYLKALAPDASQKADIPPLKLVRALREDGPPMLTPALSRVSTVRSSCRSERSIKEEANPEETGAVSKPMSSSRSSTSKDGSKSNRAPEDTDVPPMSKARSSSSIDETDYEPEKTGPSNEDVLKEKVAILTSDVANKQILIDRLLSEVDDRSSAIRKCGTEIVELRKENAVLRDERDSAVAKLQQVEGQTMREIFALSHPEDIDAMDDIDEMKRRISILGAKYVNERKRNEEITKRLEGLKESAAGTQRLAKQYEELQHAHEAQSRHFQYLQDAQAEIDTYRETIQTQEKVIMKLEDLLEAKLQDAPRGMNPSVSMELDRLRAQNEELETRLTTDTSLEYVRQLEEELREAKENGGGGDSEETKQALLDFEKQMVENAKMFAQEKSAFTTKIFEYEAKLMAYENDDD